MAKKTLKTRTAFTSTLRNDLYEQVKQVSEDTGIPISRLLDKALEPYLQKIVKTSK